jgi:hypothetical protein
MQGIQLFEYKTLLESLERLKQAEMFDLPEEQLALITEKEKILKETYSNYQLSLEQISVYIRQFEHHKNAIRRLVKDNKHYLKDARKNAVQNRSAA